MSTMYFNQDDATVITVKNAKKFVARLFIHDPSKMAIGSVVRTAMLSATGGVYGVALLVRVEESVYKIILNDENADRLEAWVHQVSAAFDSEVVVEKVQALAYIGKVEGAPEKGMSGSFFDALIVNIGWVSYAFGSAAAIGTVKSVFSGANVQCGDANALDALRILARVGASGLEIEESSCPLEVGFEDTIDFSDESRIFIGRALTEVRAREKKYDRLQLVAFAHAFDPQTLTEVPLVIVGDVGYQLTSIARIPEMNLTVGLVQLPQSVNVGDQLPALVKTEPACNVRGVLVVAPQI